MGGIIGTDSIEWNIALPNVSQISHRFWRLISARKSRALTRDWMARLRVRAPGPGSLCRTLSGGNQQKVVVARTVAIGRALLVLEEPTQGVDVGAKAEIYATLATALTRETGLGVILVSSDLEEIAGVCNRALIFRYGKIVDEVGGSDMTLRSLTALVTGAGRAA